MVSRSLTLVSWCRAVVLKRLRGSSENPLGVLARQCAFRQLHATNPSPAKLFLETENSHSHNIMKKSGRYKICPDYSFVSDCHDLSEEAVVEMCRCPPKEPQAIFEGLQHIIEYCSKNGLIISDQMFDEFIDAFGDSCEALTDEQLQTCLIMLKSLPESPGINSRNFYEIWKPLDDVCLTRLALWDTDKILKMSDCWYAVNLAKCSEFVWEGIRKIGRRSRRLTPSQLVQFTFLCNLVRKPVVAMVDVEMHFNRKFDALSLDEVGIICLGFFKTQSRLNNPELIAKIYKRLGENLQVVDNITLVNCVKVLRYSSKLTEADMMSELLERMCSHVDRISTMACLHVSLMGCDLQMCHQPCIELVLERFSREIADTRLKEMERIAHVMGLFNMESMSGVQEELCQKILAQLETRVDEIVRYPKCFQSCLHFLTLCGHYNEDLLNAALEPKFLKHVFGKNNLLGREVFCLDSFARINLKDSYKGNLLLEKQRRTMGKLFTHYIPTKGSKFKLSLTDRILVEINETCKSLWGMSSIKHVLPHFERPDIVVALDPESFTSAPLNPLCPEDYSGKILNVPDFIGDEQSRVQALVIVVGGWNNFVRATNRPTGLLKMKLNQLQMLGYRSLLIPWHTWREQETPVDKQKYLRRRAAQLVDTE